MTSRGEIVPGKLPAKDRERWANVAREYIKDFDQSRAVIASGYSPKAAKVTASRLFSNPEFRKILVSVITERNERLNIDADFVLTTIVETVKRCSQAEPVKDFEGNPTGEWRFDSAGVLKGCDMLAKHVGLYAADNKQKGEAMSEAFAGAMDALDKAATRGS